MGEDPARDREHLIRLVGSPGEAAEHLIGVARQFGYSIAATAPGTYRLARERRRGLRKHSDSVVVTVIDDRNGTKARLVGAVDPALVDRLAAPEPPGSSPQSSARPAVLAEAVSPPPAAHPSGPVGKVGLPKPANRPAALVPPPAGLISGVPGSSARVADTAPTPEADSNDHTVGRTHGVIRHPTCGERPALTLPDGRVFALDAPLVFGRDPDPARAPDGAVRVVVDEPSLSKTHAYVTPSPDGLTVVDLHSTNGTLIEVEGATTPCPPGVPISLPVRALLIAGAFRIEVRDA